MKVAWIISGFAKYDKDYKGAPAIHKLAEELSTNGEIELDIYSLYYPTDKSEYRYFNSRVFTFAEKNELSRIEKYIVWKKAEKKFSTENRKNKYDIIHSIWSGEPGNLASRLAEKHKIHFITSVCGGELAELHEINYGSRLKYWQKKFVDKSFKKADYIITGSDYIGRLIEKYYDKSVTKKIVKIPFGVDEKLFYTFKSSLKHEQRFPVLLNIASAVPVKNQKMLLSVLKLIKKRFPNALLVICGNDEKGNLKQLVECMDLGDSVSLKGFVSYEMIPDIINSSDIFVLSSFYESQNLAILESAFCGRPSVSTPVGIAGEITENLAETDNPVDFAEKVIHLAENIKSEKKKATENLTALIQKYSLKSSAGKFLDLYKMISRTW